MTLPIFQAHLDWIPQFISSQFWKMDKAGIVSIHHLPIQSLFVGCSLLEFLGL
jgi:hypothetical protein